MVRIQRPDAAALSIVLRQHLGDDLPAADLCKLAQITLGKSGADCAAAVRTARGRARREKRPLGGKALRHALAPDHLALPLATRRRAALHESGHAVVMAALAIGSIGAQILGDASGCASGAPDSDLAHTTRLLLAWEFSLGLGNHGQLSVGGKPDPGLILTLPPDTRARLQRRLDRALDDAQEILCQHHGLLEELAGDLEATGFVGKEELDARLGLLRNASQNAAGRAS